MTFTELEVLLGIAVGVLLWRISVLSGALRICGREHDKLVRFLMKIGDGDGRVVKEDGSYIFKEKDNETKSVSSS